MDEADNKHPCTFYLWQLKVSPSVFTCKTDSGKSRSRLSKKYMYLLIEELENVG